MRCRIVAEMTRQVPPEWERELARISPRDSGLSWLEFHWQFVLGKVRGQWIDRSRWVLYEMQPTRFISPHRRRMLEQPPPRLLPESIRYGRLSVLTDWQHEVHRTRGVFPWAVWVLQGNQGGTPAYYSRREELLCKAMGMPDRPPPVGTLPYAGFDWRVIEQILMRDQLLAAGMQLDAIADADRIGQRVQREIESADRAFRWQFINWFTGTLAPSADFLTWFTRRTEADRVLRQASLAEVRAASQLEDTYVETGQLPVATVGVA